MILMKKIKNLLILTLCFSLVFSTTVTNDYEINPLEHHNSEIDKK